MANQENGIPSEVVLFAAVGIASSTNASPIVVTTSFAHNLTTGDRVRVSGHATNTNANGVWDANVQSPTKVALYFTDGTPSVGNGVGANTGKVQPLSLGSTMAVPADGDDEVAASVDVAFDALADRTAFLGVSTGAYKLVGPPMLVDRTIDDASAWDSINIFSPSVWTPTSGPTIFQYALPGSPIQPGDLITVSADISPQVGVWPSTRNLTFSATAHTITLTGGGNFLTDGFVNGQAVTVSGSVSNDGVIGVLINLTPTVMTFAAGVVNEGPSTAISLTSLTGSTTVEPAQPVTGLHSLFGSCVGVGASDNFSRLRGSGRLFVADPLVSGGVVRLNSHLQSSFVSTASSLVFKVQVEGMWFSQQRPASWSLNGDYSILFQHYRATGMPQ